MGNLRVSAHKLLYLSAMMYFVSSLEENLMSQKYRQTEVTPISVEGYRLASFKIQETSFTSFIRCGHACLAKTPKCVSYNFYGRWDGFGRCELNSKGIPSLSDGITNSLENSPDTIYVQTRLQSLEYPESCGDHYKKGMRQNGLYYIRDTNDALYSVLCDFNTEPNKVWTLFMSQSLSNRFMEAFVKKNLQVDYPVSENKPNWEAYRLSLARMKDLKQRSSYWRVTCNIARGISFVDYVRAKISNFDLLTFDGKEKCMPVEYMNVMGHECTGCTSAWWQFDGQNIHHDMTVSSCGFGATPGARNSEDVFGFYGSFNSNFACTSSDDSNTNYWFGIDV